MQRVCAGCGAAIPPQKGSARPRKYCVVCRPPRNRPNPRVVHLDVPPAPDDGAVVAAGDESPLVASYRRQLEKAERLDTPEGAHLMHLVRLLASPAHTAAGAASLSREVRAAMELAMEGAPTQADKLDELSARRIEKAKGA